MSILDGPIEIVVIPPQTRVGLGLDWIAKTTGPDGTEWTHQGLEAGSAVNHLLNMIVRREARSI